MRQSAPYAALSGVDLRASLGGQPVLHGLSLRLQRGLWTSIVGPNGAGKSTLLKVLAQLMRHEGAVSLMGHPLAQVPGRERAKQLSWLGQSESSGADLTARDVVMLGRLPHQPWLSAPSLADVHAVEQSMRDTRTLAFANRVLGELSGGERQRVLLARALAVEAQVLLMDEPLANLDPPHQSDWLATVRTLTAQGKTVVSVLHELTMALQADRMLIVSGGLLAHQGECSDARTHRALERVFDDRIAIHAVGQQWVALPTVCAQNNGAGDAT